MKKKLQAVYAALGLSAKAKEKKLTADDIKKIDAAVQKEHGMSLQDALAQAVEEDKTEKSGAEARKQLDQIAALVDDEEEPTDDDDPEKKKENPEAEETEETEEEKEAKAAAKRAAATKKVEDLKSANKKLLEDNKKLSAQLEKDNPIETVRMKTNDMAAVLGHTKHTATHLFGISHDFFAVGGDKWWNKMMTTREARTASSDLDGDTAFKKAFNAFGLSVKGRYVALQKSGELANLDFKKMAAGEGSIDYTDLENELGARYLVRRTDMLISYLRTFKSITSIFPMLAGVQDKMEMTNSFVGEFSQAYQSGRQFKGNLKFQPLIASVYDVMFKHMFSNLKQLEKEYIGYLNREGSNPMKWTFLEWVFVELGKKVQNEFNQRGIQGYRRDPVIGKNASFLFGSDGYIRTLEKFEEGLYILPFELGVYDETTIVDYVEQLMEQVNHIIPSLDTVRVYINEKHIPWYRAAFRKKYGADTDFTGPQLSAIDYSAQNFIAVPNMPVSCFKIAITEENNLECYTLEPGEMWKLYFQQDLEALMAASWWKEGFGAKMVGFKYPTLAALLASDRANQFIFTNDAVTALDPDAVTVDAKKNLFFKTGENTAATAITDITNAAPGQVYRIICGSTANATTVAKAGKFANITAAWTPTAVGDYLKVTLELVDDGNGGFTTTGNFEEVERKVTV